MQMKPLKIAFNARILATNSLRGWSRYTYNLLLELAKTEHQVYLLSDQAINPQFVPESKNIHLLIEPATSYIQWEQWTQNRLCESVNADVLHGPTNYGIPFFGKTKKVLTIHDAIEKSFYDPKKSFLEKLKPTYLKMRQLNSLSQKAADRIITVSHHAKQDIHKTYDVPLEKIQVIYEAADPQFNPKAVLPLNELVKIIPRLQENYFFYVGGLEERKNIGLLLQTFALRQKKEEQLLISGGDPLWIRHYEQKAKDLQLSDRVFFTGPVEEALMPSLYRYARCFLYPSLYEGFGLQVVESLEMETPVLCANTTSLIEVLGDSECGFSPHSPHELSLLMDKMNQQDFYLRKKQYAKERSQYFSWKKTIDETLRVYQDVVKEV